MKIPGHKYYFVPTGTQPGQRPKNRDCPGEIGTLGNYVSDVHFSNFVTVLLAVLRMRTPLFLGMDGRGIV